MLKNAFFNMKRKTTEEFIHTAKVIHGDKYDYSKVVYFNNSTKVCIICPKHGEFWQTPANHISYKGCPHCKRNALKKVKFGIAINDYNGKIWDNNAKRMIPSYIQWQSMLTRCYSESYHKKYPSYIGCYVCDDWLHFSKYKEWYDKHCVVGWNVDKDIIIKGNKLYSPQTCCFVPTEINSAFTNNRHNRGKNMIGVYEYTEGRFVSTYHKKYLGTSTNEKELFLKYKFHKEKELKELAEKYKGLIDERVYNALINYDVEEGD